MKRWIWSTFIILLSLSSSMMTIQWKNFNHANAKQGMEQQIVVSHHTNFFYIEQHFKGLQTGDKLTVLPPEKSEDFTCQLGNQSCGNHDTIQIEDDSTELRFTYMIPNKKAENTLMIEDWLVETKGVPIHSTHIQLSDAMWREGSWFIGTELIAKKEMDHSDYYMFESKNHHPPIYWQKDPLERIYSDQKYMIYAAKDSMQDFLQLDLENESEEEQEEQVTIIFNPNTTAKNFEHLEMMNDAKEVAQLNEQLIKDQLRTYIQLGENDQWLYDVMASIGLQRPIGTEKSRQMYSELSENLNNEQLSNWFKRLVTYDEGPLTTFALDELFQLEDDRKVQFFNNNKIESEKMNKLQLISSKKLIINDLEVDGLFINYHGDSQYVLLDRLASYLGYYVEEQEDDVVIVYKRPITYYFFPDQHMFQFNKDRYGLDESPVIKLHDNNYISLEVLPAFFNVDIKEDGKTIYINTLRTS